MAAQNTVRKSRTLDGVEIAYRVLGAGPALLLLLPYHASDVLLNWAVPVHRRAMQNLATSFTVINVDLRGSGQSEREPVELSMDLFTRDVETVLDALSFDSACIVSGGNSSRVACYIASRVPNRVNRMALYGPADSQIAKSLHAIRHVSVNAQAEMRASMLGGLSDPRNATSLSALFKGSVTAEGYQRFEDAVAQMDFPYVLGKVRAPTFFVHASHDDLTPLATAQRMSELIALSALKIYPGTSPLTMWSREAMRDMTQFLLGDKQLEELPTRNSRTVAQADNPTGLTRREAEVLELVAGGRTNQQISDELFISLNTVRQHLKNIFYKTGATNRTEAAAFALDNAVRRR